MYTESDSVGLESGLITAEKPVLAVSQKISPLSASANEVQVQALPQRLGSAGAPAMARADAPPPNSGGWRRAGRRARPAMARADAYSAGDHRPPDRHVRPSGDRAA